MPSSSDSIRSTGYALAKYALENGSVATRYLTLHGTPAMSTQDSPKSTSIVVPGSTLRCTKASFLVVAVLSPATYQRTVRAGSGPAIGSNNRRIRFAVNRGSSRSHCLIRSRHGSRVPGRGGDTRTGGVDRLMARRTVFTSNFNRPRPRNSPTGPTHFGRLGGDALEHRGGRRIPQLDLRSAARRKCEAFAYM